MTRLGTVGIIANPLAGKDVRRLVAHASPTSDAAKIGIVRRAVVGAVEGGAKRILLSPDDRQLCRRAVDGLSLPAHIEIVDQPYESSRRDTTAMARRLRDDGVGAVIVLGGDGTHRDVAKGWLDAPLVALSTGTNNVFPSHVEATIAGHAAGMVASGRVRLGDVARRAKVLHVELGDGASWVSDLALVEISLIAASFTGSRAVWDAGAVRTVVAAIAEPTSVGLSSIPASVRPLSRHDRGAVAVVLGPDGTHRRVPLAPGSYVDVSITGIELMDEGDEFVMTGPGVLAFDGERDHRLVAGRSACITVRADGPFVIDVHRTMCRGAHGQ